MMHTGRHRARPKFRSSRKAGLTLGVAGALAVAFFVPAQAATNVSGADPGSNPPVVRGSSTTITEDVGAQFYFRTSSTGTFTDETQGGLITLAIFGQACIGDNPAAGGKNNSPRDIITVTDPSNAVVANQVSPVRNLGASGAPPANPQPAPGNSNYRGDFAGNTYHGMSFTLDLTGRPAGIYTVTTTSQNMVKTGTGTCTVGRPGSDNKSVIAGPVVTTTTFEYRPWQDTFVDVLGNGKVFANVTPTEFQFSLGSQTSSIWSGDQGDVRFYTFPNSLTLFLPPDPVPCASDPASCIPSIAQPCHPETGCVPRIMTINKETGDQRLVGIFDLTTKAFVAGAYLNGSERLLFSTGTTNDGYLHDLIQQLVDAAAAQGIDLESLLATRIRLADGQNELSLSLLDGLLIAPSTAKGLQIVSDMTVQAGVILNIYLALAPTTCVTHKASSAAGDERFTPTSGRGYNVASSDLLPAIPAVGALGAIASGPLYHITGNFPAAGTLANVSSALVGVDTAANEPNGYPVWISPFLSPAHVTSAKTMDYLGTATWSASETSLGSLGCLVVDSMVGTGVAIYNNALPVGFGTLLDPLYTSNASGDALTDQIDTAVQGVVNTVTTNPAVSSVLTKITGALPI